MSFLGCCGAALLCVGVLAGPGLAEAAPAVAPAADGVPRGQLKFRVFGAADGLQNLVIASIAQDGDGFLWLGTDDGVYRFDGERFTHFSTADGLLSSSITSIAMAPDGRPCIGSRGGLVCWDGTRFSPDRAHGLPPGPVTAIASLAGKLWIGTEGHGLYTQDATGALVPAPAWPDPTGVVRTLWADGSGLVVGHGATVSLSAGDGVWQGIGELGLGPDLVDGVLRDPRGALWIRAGSHLWFAPRGAIAALDLHGGLPTAYDAVAGGGAMAIDPRGELVVGTDAGIAYREDDHWRLVDGPTGMPVAGARTVFVDREGTLWIGSVGLFQLRGRGLLEHHDIASGLPGNVVWSFGRDREGTLWVGTNRCLARAVAGRWECLPGTEARVVRSFVFPPQGGVFLGGAPSDLQYIDAAGHPVSLGDFQGHADHNILALALGPGGDLWIATKLGLYRLPGAVPGPPQRVVIPGTQPDGRFPSLAIIGDQVWTATAEGIAVLDHGAWRLFDRTAGFRSSGFAYVIPRSGGRVCAAYSEAIGAVCFRSDGRSVSEIQHIGPDEGLTTGKVYLLGEDHRQRLWIGTGDGIDVVTPTGMDHFDERDGVAGNDATAMAFLADDDGTLWLGSSGGATHLFASQYGGPPSPPRTALLSGRLGDLSVVNAQGRIQVPHDRNALTIAFAASSMVSASRVAYQTRLSPLETGWSATELRQARYPALLPGEYHFEVRARVGAGSWGPPTGLELAVLPAWWQTRWFVALSVLGCLLVIGASFTWRQRIALRRRTRDLNERSEASFRAVIDRMPDLISVHRDRAVIYLNQAHRRFLGVDGPGERWRALELIDCVHPDDRAQLAALFRRVGALDARASSEADELRVRAADGSWRTCEVSVIQVEIGGALTMVASGRDVTERKRTRAKLLVSDRMASLGTLAAGIAHEINNPLSYVTGNLEAMAEVLAASEAEPTTAVRAELGAAIVDARDGAERVRKIVLGLRSFSRSEEEQRVQLALPGVLEAAIRLTGNEVRHRAQLVRELGVVPLVIGDDGRLTQVFINLLVNAAHAIPEGRSDANRITVRTRTDDHGRAVIEIEDTGTGMAPEVQARVFDPFFTTKDVGEGTGLGLSICHGIISGLDGQISVESVAGPGTGTLVRIVLPPAQAPAAIVAVAPSPEPATAPGPRRHRVMLVDDEPLVAQTIERLLRRDYDITVALCGRDAIAHIARGVRFDAIVSDVMMPNMTGIELIEELKRVAPDQAERLIFLSGGAFTAQTRERLDALGAPQLEKPVTAKQLRACVMRIASEARLPAG